MPPPVLAVLLPRFATFDITFGLPESEVAFEDSRERLADCLVESGAGFADSLRRKGCTGLG